MSEQQNVKELSNFIDSNPEPREQKRALAISMNVIYFGDMSVDMFGERLR